MNGTFHLLDEFRNVIVREHRALKTEVASRYLEAGVRGRSRRLRRQTAAQGFINDIAERTIKAPGFSPEFGSNIFIQDESGSHASMLDRTHQEVKGIGSDLRVHLSLPGLVGRD
jgi:hypothetical protein